MDKVAEAAVEAEKTALGKGVDVPVSPTLAKTAGAGVASAMLGDPTLGAKTFGTDLGRALDAGLLEAIGPGTTEGRNLRNTMASIFRSGQLPEKSLVGDMLSQFGFNPTDISHALDAVFSTSISELASSKNSRAGEIVDALLPAASDFQKALDSGFYSMLGDGSGNTNWEQKLLGITALDPFGNQAQIGKGKGGGGLVSAAFEQTILDDIINSMMNTPGNKTGTDWKIPTKEWDIFTGDLFSKIATDAFGNQLQLTSGDQSTGKKSFGKILGDVWGAISTNISSVLHGGSGGKGGEGDSGGGINWSAYLPKNLTNGMGAMPAGLSLAALLGVGPGGAALGAVAGSLAGTIVGGVGTVIYGALLTGTISDLSTAYKAHQQLLSGQITAAQYKTAVAGLDPGAVAAINSGLGSNFSKINTSLIHPLQTMIVGQITGLIGAAVKAAPAMAGFAKGAVQGMGGFIGDLTSGLQSPGFAKFLKALTPTEITVMKEFGKTITEIGTGLGNLLLAAQPLIKLVGPGWVSLGKDFENFTKKAKVGPDFLPAILAVGKDFSSAFGAVEAAIKKVARGAAPLGMAAFNQLPTIARFIKELVKAIPDNFATLLSTVAVAMLAFGKFGTGSAVVVGLWALAEGFKLLHATVTQGEAKLLGAIAIGLAAVKVALLGLDVATQLDPFVLALEALVVVGAYIALNWKTIWGEMKVTLDKAWYEMRVGVDEGVNGILKGVNTVISAIDSVGGFLGVGHISHIGYLSIPTEPSWGNAPSGSPTIQGLNGITGTSLPKLGSTSGSNSIQINIDARGSADPTATKHAVTSGINSMLPSLQAALARGAA